MATPADVFPYTSLPAEIRNLIMEYALVPGDVYPCLHRHTKPSSTNRLLRAIFKRPSAHFKIKVGGDDHDIVSNKQPGFQLLRTCRKGYEDGHFMFYSMNTFHLPAGSAKDVESWFDNLKVEHRDMIKSVCLTFSLADVTPEVFDEMEKKWLWDLPLKTHRLEQRVVFEVAYLLCWRYWQDKITFLKKWEGLEKVEFKSGGERFVFAGEAFREMDVRAIMDQARERVKGELKGLVEEVGWKAARKAFMTRGVEVEG